MNILPKIAKILAESLEFAPIYEAGKTRDAYCMVNLERTFEYANGQEVEITVMYEVSHKVHCRESGESNSDPTLSTYDSEIVAIDDIDTTCSVYVDGVYHEFYHDELVLQFYCNAMLEATREVNRVK